MTIEQQLQKGLDDMAAGSSDAEFEKLLSEVRSTLCLLSALEVLRPPVPLGSEVYGHALTAMSISTCTSGSGSALPPTFLCNVENSASDPAAEQQLAGHIP